MAEAQQTANSDQQQPTTAATTQVSGAEAAPDAKALQQEIERLKAESSEKDNAIRYWHEQAKGAAKSADKAAESAGDEEDLLDVVAKKGSAGLKEVLKKQGFVEASEVEQRIEQRARIIATENELAAKYPELKDSKSDFFKVTAGHYADLIRDGVPQHAAMKQAAKLAALDGYESGKRIPDAEKQEREARARAQAGAPTRKSGEQQTAEENDDLDDVQKTICERFGIDPEKYKARAKAGVVVSGKVK